MWKDSEDKRRGMNYEFDYDTEELINQFSIKKLLLPRIRDEN